MDSLHQYYWGTVLLLQRREEEKFLQNVVFPKKYSRNTGNKIFRKGSEELGTAFIYYSLERYIKPTGTSLHSGYVEPPTRMEPNIPFYWFSPLGGVYDMNR